MGWDKIVMIGFYAGGIAATVIAIWFTWKLYGIKLAHHRLDVEIAEKKLEAMVREASKTSDVLDETRKITEAIAGRIAENLNSDTSWLDRFMDQTGVTYSASVYGKRIGHFYYEKARIARDAIEALEKQIMEQVDTRYCLVIDSGTTMYPVFQELASRIHDVSPRAPWRSRVCVVTNNLPGLQYLMKHGKDDPSDEYSEVPMKCFIMPGKPLSVYAAITGVEAETWLHDVRKRLVDVRFAKPEEKVRIIGFVTGNYMARHEEGKIETYVPVARGEGHVEIKNKIVEVSDELFLLSPLMKFSFATVEQLNRISGFTIPRGDSRAPQLPKQVMYEEIDLQDRPVRYFTTGRPRGARFFQFGHDLRHELEKAYGERSVSMEELDIRYRYWAPEDSERLELEKEIPHSSLRKAYDEGKDVWDWSWATKHRQA